jgi:hypothetical protein
MREPTGLAFVVTISNVTTTLPAATPVTRIFSIGTPRNVLNSRTNEVLKSSGIPEMSMLRTSEAFKTPAEIPDSASIMQVAF